MVRAVRHTWPGFEGEHKWAEAVDALCKMHGPRGMGSAAAYNTTTESWGIGDYTMKLLEGSPDPTDVGRLWNEGLGFYGWLFYISKFYEVTDTLIILAKGKNSSYLQTFHHAGAMMCMWAGIRYMSPPIWMFVLVNSGLHGLMVSSTILKSLTRLRVSLTQCLMQYTYYALSTLSVPIPTTLKRILTTLQITQFIVGAGYAMAHLFVAYTRPVSVPYLYMRSLSSALPTAASSFSSAVTSATATAGLGSWLKKAALRAAGEEGLAENVRNAQGDTFGIDAVHAAEVERAAEEIRYKSEYQMTSCLDTPGQTFAILLNALYLFPLTVLFLRFFTQKYVLGTKQRVPPETRRDVAKESAKNAIRDLETEIKEAMDEQQHADEGTELPKEVKAKVDTAKEKLEDAKAKLNTASQKSEARSGDLADEAKSKVEHATEKARNSVSDIAERAKEELKKDMEALRGKSQSAKDKIESKSEHTKKETNGKAEKARNTADETGEKAEKKQDSKEETKRAESQTRKEKNKNQKSKIPKRDPSPIKRDASPQKKESKPNTNGNGDKSTGKENDKDADWRNNVSVKDENGTNSLDESAYEVNPDELKNEEEDRAEEEMQPTGL